MCAFTASVVRNEINLGKNLFFSFSSVLSLTSFLQTNATENLGFKLDDSGEESE